MKHDIRYHLNNLIGAVTFRYNNKECGIDPFSRNEYDIWYGDNCIALDSVDKVFSEKLFDGKSLDDILNQATDFEY